VVSEEEECSPGETWRDCHGARTFQSPGGETARPAQWNGTRDKARVLNSPDALNRRELRGGGGRPITPTGSGESVEHMVRSICLSLGAVLYLTVLPTPSVATTELRCLGAQPTIRGTPKDDSLVGTPTRDVIAGGEGDDTILGRGGNDLLCGEGAMDTLKGGRGHDKMRGGSRGDWLVGGPGDDLYNGGRANDTGSFRASQRGVLVDIKKGLARGEGHDALKQFEHVAGSRFADDLWGGGRFNSLVGGRGSDRLVGRGGSDYVSGYQGNDFLSGGPGNDVGRGGPGKDTCLSVEDQSSCEV
jgi:hypothetical protein